jgi:hypothetical protein
LVFAEAHMDLPISLLKARERLASYERDRERLHRDSVAALRNGLRLSERDGPSMRIEVLSVAPGFRSPAVTRVPVRWVRDGAMSEEVPLLDATVELAQSTAAGGVRLTVVGSYRPWPQSFPVRDPDTGQGAADATIRALMMQVATAIMGSEDTRG